MINCGGALRGVGRPAIAKIDPRRCRPGEHEVIGMDSVSLTRVAPVVGEYDVVVCGGGAAGLMAAIAAGRAGLRTALVERFGFLGGTAITGIVAPISGFFLKGRQVVGGIPFEMIKKMEELGGARIEYPRGHVSFDPEIYKLVAQRMVLEAGVELYTNSYLTGCTVENGHVRELVMENKNGAEALRAACFIDATGDADLCHMAGMEFLPRAEAGLQPLSMCFVLSGVDLTTPLLRDCIHHDGHVPRSVNEVIRGMLTEAYAAGEVPQFGGPWFNSLENGDLVTVNVTRAAADACDNRSMRDAELRLREDMFALFNKMREVYPEFKNGRIVSSAAVAGIRETRRIKGAHVLTEAEFLGGADFADSIAVAAHPIDIHSMADESQRVTSLTAAAQIPYGCLVSPRSDNVICAGRCISAEPVPFGSLRVQATCMAMGQAAGVAVGCYLEAASGAASAHVAELDTVQLIERLHALGGITK